MNVVWRTANGTNVISCQRYHGKCMAQSDRYKTKLYIRMKNCYIASVGSKNRYGRFRRSIGPHIPAQSTKYTFVLMETRCNI